MQEITKFFFEQIKPLWHKPPVALLICAFISIPIYIYFVEHTKSRWISASFAVVWILVFVLFWLYLHWIPRVPSGKIGIILSLTFDNDILAKQVKTDFIEHLVNLLQSDQKDSLFHVIVLPAFAAQETCDQLVANRYLSKSRGHYMLFGRVRTRIINKEESHILSLNGIVKHRPIPDEVKKEFSIDFRKVIPPHVIVPKDGDIFCFETTSEWTNISVRYVVGVAAHFSGDVKYAEKLLLDVESHFKGTKKLPPHMQHLSRQLPIRIENLYLDWLIALGDEYIKQQDRDLLEYQERIADKILQRNENSYHALISKSIAEFSLRRDIEASKRCLDQIHGQKDANKLYNYAFLFAYEGDLKTANENYRKAFRCPIINPNLAIQCEEFIHLILDEEPDKKQLFFCLGLINYTAKQDYQAAIRDFNLFINSEISSSYNSELTLAQKLAKKSESKNSAS